MNEAARIPVELGDRSYDVFVGAGLLDNIDELLSGLRGANRWRRAVLVTDGNVGKLYARDAAAGLRRLGLDVAEVTVEAGERSKDALTALRLVDSMAASLLARSDLVVGLGGGVVGDLAGFSASVYKRGISLIHLPTTLMAQVDSALGGKTAVNLEAGKNLAGTFHQPVAVVCDVRVLATLSERDYASGLAEVAKYTFVEPNRFGEPADDMAGDLLARKEARLIDVVGRCAGIKARMVSLDELDHGIRTFLNYGHTLGHALEAASDYDGTYTHGEAVAVGMVFSAIVAEELSIAVKGLSGRHRFTLKSLGLPVAPFGPAPDFGKLMAHIAHDKKNREGTSMVLLEEEGRPLVRGDLGSDTLAACYARLVGGA